jgi:Zn finger protein HypA/HybF involved in hydrogenase expression
MERLEAAMEDMTGFCLACGEESERVEPDARAYQCHACGESKVFGAEEIILMGAVA